MEQKTILFLHGFYASGQCEPAEALREAFEGRAKVLTPDLPIYPGGEGMVCATCPKTTS